MQPIIQFQSTSKIKYNYHTQFDRVWFMTKTRQENNLTDCMGAVYAKIKIDLC